MNPAKANPNYFSYFNLEVFFIPVNLIFDGNNLVGKYGDIIQIKEETVPYCKLA